MAKREAEDPRLVRLTKICLALPEAEREYNGQHASFRVRKKIFAYYLNDHHGDGIVAVTCKVLPGDNKALAAADPKRFYLPAYIGPRGWVALRLDVGQGGLGRGGRTGQARLPVDCAEGAGRAGEAGFGLRPARGGTGRGFCPLF